MTLMTTMNNGKEISLSKRGTINKVKTSINIRLGTKHRLLELAKKGESYDDVISRLIHTFESSKKQIENYQAILINQNIDYENRNIIEATYVERGVDGIQLSNGAIIQFSYSKPSEFNERYTMDVEIDEVIGKKKIKTETQTILEDPVQYTNIRLWIVGRIINRHFDPAFEIPANKMIIDPVYWERVKNRVGLSEMSYHHDILDLIKKYEEQIYG